MEELEYSLSPYATQSLSSEAFTTANHLTDIDNKNSTGNTQTKYNSKQQTTQKSAT